MPSFLPVLGLFVVIVLLTGIGSRDLAIIHRSAEANRTAEFALIFDSFSAADHDDVEAYLAVFDGYRHHLRNPASSDRTAYSYASTLDGDGLHRNLQMMLDHIGVRGRIHRDRRRITIEKSAGPP